MLPMAYANVHQSCYITLFNINAQPELAYADCAVSGSCDARVVLAEQLPAKLRVYTLVVCPFAGCPVPLKVAFWVPAQAMSWSKSSVHIDLASPS